MKGLPWPPVPANGNNGNGNGYSNGNGNGYRPVRPEAAGETAPAPEPLETPQELTGAH